MSEFCRELLVLQTTFWIAHSRETDEGFQFVCFHQGVFSLLFKYVEQISAFQPVPHDHTMLISIMSYFLEFMTFLT